MTADSVWDELAPEPPRDRWGRYLIDGKAHTRATTVAKALSDQGSLIQWKQRMTALGLAARPDLHAGVKSADPDDRKTLNRLVDDAAEAGGASSAANLGTALHRYVEAVNHGRDVDAGEWQPTIDAYRDALAAHGLEVVPGLVEQIVVLSSLSEPIAGTFDLAVTDGAGPPMIADLKTGRSVNYGQGEWAIQLAIYAHAEQMWDPRTDTLTPMPDVNRERALIFHAPAGKGTCDVYALDIARGWEQVQAALDVRAWRKAKGLLVPAADVLAKPAPAPTAPDGGGDRGTHTAAAIDDRVTYLRGRLAALAEHQPDAIDRVRNAWPAGAPTLAAHGSGIARLTWDELDLIDQLVVGAEAVTEAPFDSAPDPAGPLSPKHPAVEDLRQRTAALPSDLVDLVADGFEHHGIPKLSGGKATVAHLDLAEAVVAGAEQIAAERRARIDAAIAVFPGSTVITMPADVTATAVAKIDDLIDGYEAGWLDEQMQPVDGIADLLLERFGNRRTANTAARAAAADLGVDPPRSFDEVCASVPLVARLAVTDGPES